MIQNQEIHTQVALYKKRELKRNCLLTLVQATLITLVVGYGLGIKNIGPFHNVSLLEKYQIAIISGAIVVSTVVGVRIAVQKFFDKEESDAELVLMLQRLNQGKLWGSFQQKRRWFAIGHNGITHVTIVLEKNNGFADSIGAWSKVDKEKKLSPGLRLKRGMVAPIYSITLASLIVLGIGLVVKYREGFLSFTENQAMPLILSGAIITTVGVSILGIEKIIRKENSVRFHDQEEFNKVCTTFQQKPLTSAQITKQCDALIKSLLNAGTFADEDFDLLHTLLRSPAISDSKKVEIFWYIELRKNPLNKERILALQHFIFTEMGSWKNVSDDNRENSRIYFSSETLPTVTWEQFRVKFQPHLPLEQFED